MDQSNRKKITLEAQEVNSISWQVMERILVAFYEHGSLKKSQITMKSGLKYNNCMRYLKWLHEKMEFIEFEISSDHKQIKSIKITAQGMSFCKNKILVKEHFDVKKKEEFLFV